MELIHKLRETFLKVLESSIKNMSIWVIKTLARYVSTNESNEAAEITSLFDEDCNDSSVKMLLIGSPLADPRV